MVWTSPDVFKTMARRDTILKKIRDDYTGKTLAAYKKHYENGNYVDFINDWMFTYDPRLDMGVVPFLLFPRQEEYIHWLQDRVKNKEDGVTEKSRDMGITCLCCAFAVCELLLCRGSKIGFGSRKEGLVDTLGDPDSIFEKIRFILRHIPKEFLPIGFNEKMDMPFLKIINRANGSTIVGEGGENIGRGGRNKAYFKDESAFYARAKQIDAALSQNSPTKIDVSTPNGTGNPFYEKAHNPLIPKFTFHWKDDPRKDQAWYEKEVSTTPAFIVAQEIDIDYHASLTGTVIPAKYIRACIGFKIPKTGVKRAGLDVADEEGVDTNALALGQGVTIDSIQEWNGINTTLTARQAWRRCKDYGVEWLNYDSIGVGAGVRGELDSLRKKDAAEAEKNNSKPYKPVVTPVNTAPPPKRGMTIKGRKDKDYFASMKSKYWWLLRIRCEKTFEYVTGINTEHNLDDLISLPDIPELISELSQATYDINGAGKIIIDKKGDGTKSPNKADAVVLYFAPRKATSIM